MAHDDIPTVTVVGQNGPMIINESDYDPAVHKLVGKSDTPAPAAPEPAAPVSAPTVVKKGRRFIIEQDGQQVGDDTYTTDAEAWTAVMALSTLSSNA